MGWFSRKKSKGDVLSEVVQEACKSIRALQEENHRLESAEAVLNQLQDMVVASKGLKVYVELTGKVVDDRLIHFFTISFAVPALQAEPFEFTDQNLAEAIKGAFALFFRRQEDQLPKAGPGGDSHRRPPSKSLDELGIKASNTPPGTYITKPSSRPISQEIADFIDNLQKESHDRDRQEDRQGHPDREPSPPDGQ